MPDQLLQFDRHLFYFINHDMANPFFDLVMPWLRTPTFWIPLYLFIIIFCLWKYKKKGIIIILFIAASAGFADFTSNHFIKPAAHRLRPCSDPVTSKTDIERVIDKNGHPVCGSGFSFPSIHAADHFAMAFFMIMLWYKKWRWIWFWGILWAGSVSFAQIYVGVHFPIDVIGGTLYGILVGWLLSLLFKQLQPKYPAWVPVV